MTLKPAVWMLCGIYEIMCTQNGMRYVGQSSNIHARWKGHLSQLRRGAHGNPRLQNCFNKHGEASLRFMVLEQCTVEVLTAREQHHFDQVPASFRLNAGLFVDAVHRGTRLSDEHKQKVRIANLGRKASAEHCAAMSKAKKGAPCVWKRKLEKWEYFIDGVGPLSAEQASSTLNVAGRAVAMATRKGWKCRGMKITRQMKTQ